MEPSILSRMPELLLLVGDPGKAHNDNHERLPAAFRRAGWSVTVTDHDNLQVVANRLLIEGRDPGTFNLIWPLGFGRQVSFLDRMQLLSTIASPRFVVHPTVLLSLHGKHRWLQAMPETHTSNQPDVIFDHVSRGGDWVVKPTAGSYGRNVVLFRAGEATQSRIHELSRAEAGGYLMAQRFVPEIAQGEKRTLIAGGEIVGTYMRMPDSGGLSNLARGGQALTSCLSEQETALVEPIGRELAELGAGFAAVDTVFPYLMEVNVANPGGLATLATLGERDVADSVVRAVVRWAEG